MGIYKGTVGSRGLGNKKTIRLAQTLANITNLTLDKVKSSEPFTITTLNTLDNLY